MDHLQHRNEEACNNTNLYKPRACRECQKYATHRGQGEEASESPSSTALGGLSKPLARLCVLHKSMNAKEDFVEQLKTHNLL